MTNVEKHNSPQMMTVTEVAEKLAIGKSTIWRKIKEVVGFPQPVYVGIKSPRWYESDIDEWLFTKRTAQ